MADTEKPAQTDEVPPIALSLLGLVAPGEIALHGAPKRFRAMRANRQNHCAGFKKMAQPVLNADQGTRNAAGTSSSIMAGFDT